MALNTEPTLAQGLEGEAIIIVASNATPKGKPRSILLSRVSVRLQENLNPLIVIRTQRIELASYTQDSPSSVTGANNLNIKEDTTRWSFDDGFEVFEFVYRRGTSPPNKGEDFSTHMEWEW